MLALFIHTYQGTIKMKLADVKSNINIGASKEINDKNLNFKIGNHVRISKYNFFFAKGFTPSWPEDVFVVKRVKTTVSWTYL